MITNDTIDATYTQRWLKWDKNSKNKDISLSNVQNKENTVMFNLYASKNSVSKGHLFP